ncbi:MAG: hypothetical protein IMF02_09015, partial [Proteobacteria bacterium]|nr:hypothetical protein [Pseudomonadota bacterium]
NFLFIAGGKDHVVTPAMSRDLVEKAQQRGALVLRDPEMAHPFLDRSILVRERRRGAVSSFLLRGMATGEE